MEYIIFKDKHPKEEGQYQVKIKTEKGYRESKALWTPHVGFVLVDDSLVDDEYIIGWKNS